MHLQAKDWDFGPLRDEVRGPREYRLCPGGCDSDDNYTVGPTPTEEFTLAAFGLGDFERPTARATNRGTYYWHLRGYGTCHEFRARRNRPVPPEEQGAGRFGPGGPV